TSAERSRGRTASTHIGARARRRRASPAACPRLARPCSFCRRVWPPVRSLSPDEAELWARVAATITPLSREKVAPQPVEKPASAAPRTAPPPPARRPQSRPRPVPISDQTLDGSWDKRLRTGSVEPDRIVDLQGMNLDGAWTAIDRSLEQAIRAGDRVVLLITGHHRPGD